MKNNFRYCPYCGKKLEDDNCDKSKETYPDIYCAIDHGICLGEYCTRDFKNNCRYLRRWCM